MGSSQSAIHVAAQRGDVEKVQRFLNTKRGRQNLDAVDRFDSTPLHLACEKGHDAVVRMLVENGANVHARGIRGCTPLYCASS